MTKVFDEICYFNYKLKKNVNFFIIFSILIVTHYDSVISTHINYKIFMKLHNPNVSFVILRRTIMII